MKTAETIKDILAANSRGCRFEVLSNPEFLAEGTAVADLLKPDRVLIGGERTPAGEAAIADPRRRLRALGAARADHHDQPLVLGAVEAGGQRLSRPAHLLDQLDLGPVRGDGRRRGRGGPARSAGTRGSGPKFLKASVGFGGSCFQKDILNLVYLCEHFGLPEVAAYWESVVQDERLAEAPLCRHASCAALFNSAADKQIAVLGFAFKKDTNDTRESAAIAVCRDLLAEQARVVGLRSEGARRADPPGCPRVRPGQSPPDRRPRPPTRRPQGAHALAIADGMGRVQDARLREDPRRHGEAGVPLRRAQHPRPAKLGAIGFRAYGIGKQAV